MQRPNTKKIENIKDIYELRDQTPQSSSQMMNQTPQSLQMMRQNAIQPKQQHHILTQPPSPTQFSPPTPSTSKPRQFTIPSSSNFTPPPSSPKPQFPPSSYQFMNISPSSQQQQQQFSPQDVAPRSLHCITIAEHIVDCPICGRLYRNYTPVYTIMIIVLVIVIIVLLIKFLRPVSKTTTISSIPPITLPH